MRLFQIFTYFRPPASLLVDSRVTRPSSQVSMQEYELLFVIPGTLSEDEAKSVVEKVKETVEKTGATDVSLEHGGKNRLAYPMKHIRYGFFEMCYFAAEPAMIPVMNEKLRLMSQMLRVIIRKRRSTDTKGLSLPYGTITHENLSVAREGRKEVAFGDKPEIAAVSAPAAAPIETTEPVETKVETEQIETITKKLDEMLEKDISSV